MAEPSAAESVRASDSDTISGDRDLRSNSSGSLQSRELPTVRKLGRYELKRLLAGRTPFEGPPAVVLQQVLAITPPPLTEFASDVDPRLVAICDKTLQPEPRDRYATCGELAADLRRYLRDDAVQAAPLSPLQVAVRWIKKNQRDAAIAGAAGLLALTMFAVSVFGFSHALSDAHQAAESERKAQAETERLQLLQTRLETQVQEVQSARDAVVKAQAAEAKSLELVTTETKR